jgi:hypothetical protein
MLEMKSEEESKGEGKRSRPMRRPFSKALVVRGVGAVLTIRVDMSRNRSSEPSIIMCLLGAEGFLGGGLIARMKGIFVKDGGKMTGRERREGETESSDSEAEL